MMAFTTYDAKWSPTVLYTIEECNMLQLWLLSTHSTRTTLYYIDNRHQKYSSHHTATRVARVICSDPGYEFVMDHSINQQPWSPHH